MLPELPWISTFALLCWHVVTITFLFGYILDLIVPLKLYFLIGYLFHLIFVLVSILGIYFIW